MRLGACAGYFWGKSFLEWADAEGDAEQPEFFARLVAGRHGDGLLRFAFVSYAILEDLK